MCCYCIYGCRLTMAGLVAVLCAGCILQSNGLGINGGLLETDEGGIPDSGDNGDDEPRDWGPLDDAGWDTDPDAISAGDGDLRDDSDVDVCVPQCDDRQCGDDGCGGLCGPGCPGDSSCYESLGLCIPDGWVVVEAGTFMMGSPVEELGRDADEQQHEVTLTRNFMMYATEVTQAEYQALMDDNPSNNATCTECPVANVTWHMAAAYLNALSALEGLPQCYLCCGADRSVVCEPNDLYGTPYDCSGYRMPLEAEWEYAARAGDGRATYRGELDGYGTGCESPHTVLDSIAWFCGNTSTSQPVRSLEPNALGLYDMLGNLWEWVHDGFVEFGPEPVVDPVGPNLPSHAVHRGSSYNFGAGPARAASRRQETQTHYCVGLGIRPVRTLSF